jgi:hypothetical protein
VFITEAQEAGYSRESLCKMHFRLGVPWQTGDDGSKKPRAAGPRDSLLVYGAWPELACCAGVRQPGGRGPWSSTD